VATKATKATKAKKVAKVAKRPTKSASKPPSETGVVEVELVGAHPDDIPPWVSKAIARFFMWIV
jgi:hypothetical protein